MVGLLGTTSMKGRTLPRVRELKLELKISLIGGKERRTLPRVRELKLEQLEKRTEEGESHPSQGA